MRILLLCWRDSTHPQGGGSERYLERAGEYLAAQGHEVVYRTAGHTDAPRRSMRDGVRYSRSGGKYTVYPLALAGMLLGRLKMGTLKDFDAVVDTQNGIPFFARLVAGVPTVLLTHHCHREQWPVAGPVIGKLGWFLESQVAPRLYRGAPYVTVSTASRADLVDLGVNSQDISIINNGIDPVPGRLPTLEDDGRIHLVTLSRLVPHKQIEHALDALAELAGPAESAESVAPVVLDIIGSGWWEERLQDYARELGVSDRVKFYGQVSEDYKHALLERAALHLMPSRKEGWGLAVVEAAQHGVPTVGYREAGGLRDSINDGVTGVLIDEPRELAGAIRRLLNDEEQRRALGERAQEVAAGYSWEETGARFEQLLRRISGNDAPSATPPQQ